MTTVNTITLNNYHSNEEDYEGYMVRTQLRRMSSQSQELLILVKDEDQFPSWMQSKITLASEYMDGFYDYYKYSDQAMMKIEESEDEELESEDEELESEDSMQVTIGDYTTRHFDACPLATELYTNILSKTDMIHLVVESLMLQDILFKIKKQAIAMDAADEDMVIKAQHYASMIMDLATQMSLVEEHEYVQEHVAAIKELTNSSITIDMSERINMEETYYVDLSPVS